MAQGFAQPTGEKIHRFLMLPPSRWSLIGVAMLLGLLFPPTYAGIVSSAITLLVLFLRVRTTRDRRVELWEVLGGALLVLGVIVTSSKVRPRVWDGVENLFHKKRSATVEYWKSLRKVVSEVPAFQRRQNPSTDQANGMVRLKLESSQIREAARQIRSIPTMDVDPELVSHAIKGAEYFDRMADFIPRMERLGLDRDILEQNGSSWSTYIESFVRGFLGDPFGKGKELKAENAKLLEKGGSLLREFELLQSELTTFESSDANLRARLTERYRIQF